ncbi:hypothetical protein Tco_0699840 [Tanacetum coccineum]
MEEDKETDEVEEVEEVEEDDEAELKKHWLTKHDDDIAIDAIPLATKPPGINRKDLLTLWKLIKTKHGDIRLEDDHERVMWGDFKVMFEPDIRIVNAIRVNQENAVKASACWVWRPTKPNGASISLKKHNYIDARGRSNSVMSWWMLKAHDWEHSLSLMILRNLMEGAYGCILDLLTKGFDAGRFQYLVSSISKEVGTPRYLSLVVLLTKVGDEAVHKELGDIMERVATTVFSLKAEQDRGSGPRCQDTILGDVNAQTRFEITSKQSNDPPLSRGYTLGSEEDINPIIYTSCIEQFWATAKVQTVNRVRQLQALVDKKRVIITELSIRRDLHLDDAEGTDCLPTATIFEELTRIGVKSTAWNKFSSSMAFLIICLATNQKFNLSKYIFDAIVKHLDGGVKFLMYPCFLQVFINQQLEDMSTHKKIFVNPFHTKKVFANMKRDGKNFSGIITPLFDTMMVQASEEVGEDSDHPTNSTQIPIIDQPSTSSKPKKKQTSKKTQRQEAEVLDLEKAKDAQAKEIAALKKRIQESLGDPEDASKHGRSIADLDKDDDMPMEAKDDKKDEQSTKLNDSTAGEAVTTASVEGSAAPTTIEEITLAQTLIQIKAAKPKVVTTAATTTTTTRLKARRVVVQEPSEFRAPQEAQPSISKDKGKGIMIEPKVPLKRKDQIALDEQIARDIQAKLDAELIEEQKLARKQKEEANIALIESWENTQAMMEADRLLAERLQSKEREELTDEEKGKLFMELIKKRRKHFAALRAEEKRNRPPTKAQKRTQMSTYL